MEEATENRTFTLSKWDARQRVLLYIGAAYDGGFGIPLLFIPAWTTGMLNVEMPDVGVLWIRLDGIFLIVMALIYLVTARDPARYLGNVGIALFGKVVSVVFYSTYVFALGASKTWLVIAIADAVLGYLHYWALGPQGLKRIRASLTPAVRGGT